MATSLAARLARLHAQIVEWDARTPEENAAATRASLAASGCAVYVAVDVEGTGYPLNRNEMFAVGISVGAIAPNGTVTVLDNSLFVRDLGRPSDVAWADHWASRGWEMRCWDQFWRLHEAQLDAMQEGRARRPHTVHARAADMMADIDSKLAWWEHNAPIAGILFDTVAYDAAFLTAGLEAHGFRGIAHTRGGDWRSVYEVDGYRLAAAGLTPAAPAAAVESALAAMDSGREFAPDDHNPMSDAQRILEKFAAAVAWLQRPTDAPTPHDAGKALYESRKTTTYEGGIKITTVLN